MTRINLLPWREVRRKQRERQFTFIAAGSLLLMVAVIFYVHIHFGKLIDNQTARNDFLNTEIAALEKQIGEINNLAAEKARLLARMTIIQELQASRPASVHLLDELVTTLPEGTYYNSVKQQGNVLTLEGVAQSNARVSSLMRNIESSPWLENPVLDLIESKENDQESGARYVLRVNQKVQSAPVIQPPPPAQQAAQ
ncbi:MAG: PilN domain-containing protein [Gammaproteobacteria bacterium]